MPKRYRRWLPLLKDGGYSMAGVTVPLVISRVGELPRIIRAVVESVDALQLVALVVDVGGRAVVEQVA